jgi:NitT/TauT family transport system substrate-binding protein
MRLTTVGKVVLVLIVVVAIYFGYRWKFGPGNGSRKVSGDQGLLGRPLQVGVVTWPGYAGGIVANNGFKPNKDCIYWNDHKLLVEFLLMEDVDARSKAFSSGKGVDIVWSTVDFWANELPGFVKGGIKAKAIMQVDWSRGGDAIVAEQDIRKIEDLVNKKISLALFTPSHWLLEYSLQNSSLDENQVGLIVKNLVGKNASPDARADFVAGKVNAAVVWEPDVTEALQKRPNSHVLLSSATAANLIADLMVARDDFIRERPDVIRAFIRGWIEGTADANRHPDKVVKLLMENEPLYKDLGSDTTQKGLATVKWADLTDNTQMFGLDRGEAFFDNIFKQASQSWVKRGYIGQPVPVQDAKDDSFLREICSSAPGGCVRPPDMIKQKPQVADPRTICEQAVLTKPINIFFASGNDTLDANAKQVVDQGMALTAQAYSNAYICVEGNTDNRGSVRANMLLSDARANKTIDYLVQKHGLSRVQFISKGNGPNNPVCQEDTDECRARNRRTDVKFVPRDQKGH